MRLIDADALVGQIQEWRLTITRGMNKGSADEIAYTSGMLDGFAGAVEEIEGAPTIEAEPVRHGRWVRSGPLLKCGVCGSVLQVTVTPFCALCGTKMALGVVE